MVEKGEIERLRELLREKEGYITDLCDEIRSLKLRCNEHIAEIHVLKRRVEMMRMNSETVKLPVKDKVQ